MGDQNRLRDLNLQVSVGQCASNEEFLNLVADTANRFSEARKDFARDFGELHKMTT